MSLDSGKSEIPITESHGSCGCGEDIAALPLLNATQIPHAIRHGAIFGALDSLAPGAALILEAPHDPLPLLAQLDQRAPAAFGIEYVKQGPDSWQLKFTRNAR